MTHILKYEVINNGTHRLSVSESRRVTCFFLIFEHESKRVGY